MNCARISTSDPRAFPFRWNRNGLQIFDLTRFLEANRPHPRIKFVGMLRWKTLWWRQYLPRSAALKIKRRRSCQFPGTSSIFAKSYEIPRMYRRGWILSEPYAFVIPKVEP